MIPPPQTGSDVETIMTTHTSKGYEKVYYIMRLCGDSRTGTKARLFALIKEG